jgi:hypothetical protein
MVLAGDYLNGLWEVANMEAACYEGRRAAEVVLSHAGSHGPPVHAIPPYRPPEWEPLKRIDEDRYRRGQPNIFDTDMTVEELKAQLSQLSSLAGIHLA